MCNTRGKKRMGRIDLLRNEGGCCAAGEREREKEEERYDDNDDDDERERTSILRRRKRDRERKKVTRDDRKASKSDWITVEGFEPQTRNLKARNSVLMKRPAVT